jgi:hypothetical protein
MCSARATPRVTAEPARSTFCNSCVVSNHAHRHPLTQWEPAAKPGFFRRLLGLGPRGPRTEPAAVGYASSPFDAELMAGYLRNNGIHAVVSPDDVGGLYPGVIARVRVLVPRGQHATAHKLIAGGK